MKDADDHISIGQNDTGSLESALGLTQPEKPPTQGVGVQGIAPKPIELTPAPVADWAHLVELPPFQMYAVEKAGKSASDVMAWIVQFVGERGHSMGEQELYDDYCEWHAKKGYWPKETPTGAPLD